FSIKLARRFLGLWREFFVEAKTGPVVAQRLVEGVGIDQLLIAGDFDESAARGGEVLFGRGDEGFADAFASRWGRDDERGEPADGRGAMQDGSDVDRDHANDDVAMLRDQHLFI